jgi:hypothetical protein
MNRQIEFSQRRQMALPRPSFGAVTQTRKVGPGGAALRAMRFAAFVCVVDTDRQQSRRGSDRMYVREFTMRYRSVLMSVAALALPPIAVADAQSVYVAPGGVYVASGNVYVTPAPRPLCGAGPRHC